MLVFSMLSLLCVVNNDIFKSVYFYVYTNARPPGGPCPPPRRPRAAPRYAPATRRFRPTYRASHAMPTHNVAHAWEVIVNHGECSVAMPAWVGGWCEIRDDRPHIPSLKCRLKNTPPHTANGHCQKSPNIGEKCLAYVRYFAQEKVLHTFRAGKSGMVFVAKTQFSPKNPLDNPPSTP